MNLSQTYILISLAVLAVIFLLLFFVARKGEENRPTPLTGLAFGFVLASFLFGGERLIGYSLMGIGVIIAIIDIFQKSKK